MDEDFHIADANRAVDTIVKTLHTGEPRGTIVVNEVVKGGSLGHGTAVPGHYDIDIVIYSESVDKDEACSQGFHKWLRIFENHLDRHNPGKLSDRDEGPHSIKYTFDDKIEVDMLTSPHWREPSELYRFLQRIPEQKRFSFTVSASKWQVDFFKHKPNQVKEFIRRAKAWRNVKWAGNKQGKPKSFLLSVIVLRAYEKADKMLLGDTSTRRIALQTTAEVKKIVDNNQEADIYWEEYYRKQSYPDLFPRYKPRIVDPANPSNNLHKTGISGRSNTKASDYGEGGGPWDNFVRFVGSLDLTKSVDEIQS